MSLVESLGAASQTRSATATAMSERLAQSQVQSAAPAVAKTELRSAVQQSTATSTTRIMLESPPKEAAPPAEACPLVRRQPPISLRCVSPKSLPSFRKSRKKNSHYCAVQPPSTGMVVPVTLWATRSQSQSASAPISSGSEVRNEGCFSPKSSAMPASRFPP